MEYMHSQVDAKDGAADNAAHRRTIVELKRFTMEGGNPVSHRNQILYDKYKLLLSDKIGI